MKKFLIFTLFALLSLHCAAQSFTIHLMGDSTCAEKNLSKGSPERGWGMMLQNFMDSQVRVVNYAVNGRSTKSFRDRGHWNAVKAGIRPGDYVFIQFGHNDAKESDPERYAAAWGAYSDNLRAYIDTVRLLGATPVLLTPVSRRWFKGGRLDRNCHTDYPAAMKAVAAETGTMLLDMTDATMNWLESLGDEGSRPYYMNLPPGRYASHPDGLNDNTHTNARGARKLAEIVCDSLKVRIPAIGEHLVHYDIVVSSDGHGDYMTVQDAIDAVPDYSHGKITTILIKAGTYYGQVTVPHNKFRIHIKGEGADKTIITYDKYAEKFWPDSDLKTGTSGSATMYIHSSYVTLEDLTVENSSGEGRTVGQAVALFTDGDFIFVHRCSLVGNQDTLYTYGRYGKDGGIKRNYYLDCYIEGTTDFIFGPSICLFENCTIHSKKNSYVTAASTLPGQKYGYVFRGCTLTADASVTKCYLGRPWGAYAKTVFIECELGGHILPAGWHDWEKPGKPDTRKNSFYAEYNCSGPGSVGKVSTSQAVRAGRESWTSQLTDRQAKDYTFDKIMFQENDGIIWNPYENK